MQLISQQEISPLLSVLDVHRSTEVFVVFDVRQVFFLFLTHPKGNKEAGAYI